MCHQINLHIWRAKKYGDAIIRADVIIGTNTVCVGLRYPPIRKIEISKKKKNKRILPDKTGKIVMFWCHLRSLYKL